MKPLILISEEDTPSVLLDKENEIFEISGLSLPENPKKFYEPVLLWIEEYFKNLNAQTVFTFKLKYFNTASAKELIRLYQILTKGHNSKKSQVKILWYYPKDDEDLLDFGNNFLNDTIPLEAIPI